MISQTIAIFVDSYRELSAKKIFWLATAISGVVVLVIAAAGYTESGNLAIVGQETSIPLEPIYPDREVFYKSLFVNFGLAVWLAWGATILALASTAGVFPDFVAGGAIDLALSKPITRTRLFLTKYFAALLFAALQVAVFSSLCFLVIGIRGGAWEPAIFLAIPIIVLFYSFLYCMCALFGIVTRSAMTALVLTLLMWFVVFVVHAAEAGLLTWRTHAETRVQIYETTIAKIEGESEETPGTDPRDARAESDQNNARQVQTRTNPFEPFIRFNDEGVSAIRLERAKNNLDKAKEAAENARYYHRISLTVKTALPKTAETIALLERWLIDEADLPSFQEDEPVQVNLSIAEDEEMPEELQRAEDRIVRAEMQREYRARSPLWILGTSLAFEAAVLGIAVWRFNRRDF